MRNKVRTLLLLTFLTLPAVYGLIRAGFYEPHDTHHLADIYEMWRAFASGQVPPRWGPDFLFGYGYPLFNYYYHLPFYLGAVFYSIFGSLTLSFKLVFLSLSLLSVYGMYLLLKEFFGKWPSIAGSVLFLYTPYRAVQIYVRGAMGEALALSLLPLVLWIVVRFIKKPSRKLVGIASIIFFLFIISHNYFFALSTPFMLLLALLLKAKSKITTRLFSLLTVYILSLLIASYWLGPALLEKSLVRTETPFPLEDHFPFIKQLIIPTWGYGASVWGPYDEISFQIGVVNLLVLVVGLLSIIFMRKKIMKDKNSNIYLWAMFGYFVSLVFMNYRTLPIWKIIPFHDLVQFPWRLLNFTTLFSSIVLAFLLDIFKSKTYYKTAAILFILFPIFATISYFQGSNYTIKSDEEYLQRFFNNKNYSEDYLLLPNWVKSRAEGPAENVFESASDLQISEEKLNAIHFRAIIETEENTPVLINKTGFPGWQIKEKGKIQSWMLVGEHGEMGVLVSKGVTELELEWKETPLRIFFDYISLLTFIYVLFLIFSNKILYKKS